MTTAIVGAMHNKRFNPNHPMTPEEIYNSAREACLAGAPSIHLHVRDEQGYSVLDPDLFHQVIDPLKEEFPEVVIDGLHGV
ncbi:MAG: 3-keto-5-aminohexanoate cleavage protein [Flavonifractor plautii]